jgi:hypothetical protein
VDTCDYHPVERMTRSGHVDTASEPLKSTAKILYWRRVTGVVNVLRPVMSPSIQGIHKSLRDFRTRSAQAATLLELMYHSRIVLSVGGSMWYMIRNLRCTVAFDSVLANSKTQNAFLFTVNAIFLHDYPLAVEGGSTPRPLVQKKLGEILYLLICSFLPCLSWLLRRRVRKSRRDLRITL